MTFKYKITESDLFDENVPLRDIIINIYESIPSNELEENIIQSEKDRILCEFSAIYYWLYVHHSFVILQCTARVDNREKKLKNIYENAISYTTKQYSIFSRRITVEKTELSILSETV